MIDGIGRPPFVLHRGLWHGVLHLAVLEPKPGLRAYGVEVPCEIYACFEETIYSLADHGGRTGDYDGEVYIKEAQSSALLHTYAASDPLDRRPRHFLFVGGDYCYEVLGFSEPAIRALDSLDEAYAWVPSKQD